jgi:hypothetical protein
MTQTEALKLALEALEWEWGDDPPELQKAAITAIKAALEAKDEPVPVAIVEVFGKDWRLDYMALPVGKHKLYAQQYTYTTPPHRKPLTDEEIILIVAECAASHQHTDIHFARAIERAHGIKELV